MPLYSVLFFASWIVTGNETVSSSDVLGAYLDIFWIIIYILNFSPSGPLTKEFFFVIIEALIICCAIHEKIVLYATPYTRAMETVTGFPFSKKGVLYVITAVTPTPTFSCSLYFPKSTPLIFNGSTLSISFE